MIGITQVDPKLGEADATCLLGAEAGPLSPQASAARPPLARDTSQALPTVSSAERLQATGTPGKLPQAKAQPVQLKPGHKVCTPYPSTTASSRIILHSGRTCFMCWHMKTLSLTGRNCHTWLHINPAGRTFCRGQPCRLVST